jgi:hypothetical protein
VKAACGLSMSDNIPLVTITPLPEAQSSNRIVSKFYEGNNPASPAAANNDGLTFADVLDVINPLQHLPIIGYAYRAITGDEASTQAKMTGGAAYGAILGGPIGALFSIASAAFGALFGIDDALDGKETAVAQAKAPTPL